MSTSSEPSEKKATRSQRKGAKEILRVGTKVLAYRRDLLPAGDLDRLERSVDALGESLRVKNSTGNELEEKAKAVDEDLQRSGGIYYHRKSLLENVEMLLVAAIVVIGIRSFFLQPFVIPTNSMYPSFYGLQPNVYEDGEEVPGAFGRAAAKIVRGASHFQLKAESSGNLYLVLQNGGSFRYETSVFPNGKFFVFPTSVREYVFEIGGKEHLLRVPVEFDLDELLAMKFAGVEDLRDLPLIVTQDHGFTGKRMKLSDRTYKEGEIALAFDILLGDALFVDRMSYNFVTPKTGDPAVFRTGTIDAFNREIGTPVMNLIAEDKYYIKRLVGEPGDTLEMRVPEDIFTNGTNLVNGVPGVLYRNGKPIDGKTAFEQNRLYAEALAKDPNATSVSGFPAYRAEGLLSNRRILKVPSKSSPGNQTGQNGYYAMGDNSTDSLDGRAWGFVPEQEIIGRAFLIYYPFTKRWGIAN